MRLKHICFMIILSLLIISSIGCIMVYSPNTSEDICLDSNNPEQSFYVILSNDDIPTWTMNNVIINSINTKDVDNDTISSVNINYIDFSSGIYKLKVVDNVNNTFIDTKSWTIVITNDNVVNEQSINNEQNIVNEQSDLNKYIRSKSWNDIWSDWEHRLNKQMNKKR